MCDWLEEIVAMVMDALSVPLKVALVFLNMLVLLFWLFTIGLYGYYSILGLTISEVPIVYLVAKETWRQMRLLPKTEGFDFNSEQMDRAIEEYVRMVKKKKSHAENSQP